jgi:hypothetical protein
MTLFTSVHHEAGELMKSIIDPIIQTSQHDLNHDSIAYLVLSTISGCASAPTLALFHRRSVVPPCAPELENFPGFSPSNNASSLSSRHPSSLAGQCGQPTTSSAQCDRDVSHHANSIMNTELPINDFYKGMLSSNSTCPPKRPQLATVTRHKARGHQSFRPLSPRAARNATIHNSWCEKKECMDRGRNPTPHLVENDALLRSTRLIKISSPQARSSISTWLLV